jgi:hypothetical protein
MKYIKAYENDKIKNFELIYSIPEKEFKLHGYELKKLYARNYKVYHKKIDQIDIWCWVAGKTIEIKDFYQNSIYILNYYLANCDKEDKLMKSKDGSKYLNVRFNITTKEIKNFLDIVKVPDFLTSEYMIGEDWSSIILRKEAWDEIIEELSFLTNGKIKEYPNYEKWRLNKNQHKYNI